MAIEYVATSSLALVQTILQRELTIDTICFLPILPKNMTIYCPPCETVVQSLSLAMAPQRMLKAIL